MKSTTTISIHEYQPHHQPWFEKFNRAWIEKYFWMEPIDFDVLQRPEDHILNNGGTILMAYCGDEVAGTVALKYSAPGVYEFTKMAVDEKFRGQKIGRALADAAIEKAKRLGAHKIILYSHTSLTTAISLYRKIGFVEVPVDGPYKRSDIKMELKLSFPYQVRKATVADVEVLREVAIKSFRDLLEKSNTTEDMELYVRTNFTPEKLKGELQDTGNVYYLFFDTNVVAGYLKLRVGYEPEELLGKKAIEIERLYCTAEYMGRGLGRVLMETAMNHARENNFELVWLGVWEHNPRAIAFYEKCGFEKFGEHDFILGTDRQTDWMMMKKI